MMGARYRQKYRPATTTGSSDDDRKSRTWLQKNMIFAVNITWSQHITLPKLGAEVVHGSAKGDFEAARNAHQIIETTFRTSLHTR